MNVVMTGLDYECVPSVYHRYACHIWEWDVHGVTKRPIPRMIILHMLSGPSPFPSERRDVIRLMREEGRMWRRQARRQARKGGVK